MSNADEQTDLQLLITDAEELVPVLEGGLPESSLTDVPAPDKGPRGRDSMELAAPDRDPNDLPAQRWAVIAPHGEDGDRMIEAIRALIDHRHAQQGAAPKIYRVEPGMDSAAAIRWRNDVHRDEDVPEDERPHYLLILGDLDGVSLELQHTLANGALVGRLHCATITGFRSYAEKVVARERAEPSDRGRSLFYTVQDGTSAIQTGYSRLVEPCMQMTQAWSAAGKLDRSTVSEIPYSDWSPDEMLATAGLDEPSVLLSLSHGLGAPRKGWRSPDQQRALQGALSMGLESPLSADAVHDSPFLPGGIWMCIACYAAGTPEASAFYPWLAQLAQHGGSRQPAADVLRSLPRPGDRPFVAALPQALLANPRGPVAVIGHMDLAWTFSFTDPGNNKSRASRMFSTLRSLLAGSRVGVGLDALMSVYRETNNDLTASYQSQRDALVRGQPDPTNPRTLGRMWMQRNDLRGYVLLGDPATRLPVKSDQPALQHRPRPAPTARPPELITAAAPPPESPAPPPPTPPPPPPPPPEPFMSTTPTAPPDATPPGPSPVYATHPPAPYGAAPLGAMVRPRTLENPEIALRERAVLAMIRGDEAPRSISMRFGLPLEEIFYWLDVYREAGRKALGG